MSLLHTDWPTAPLGRLVSINERGLAETTNPEYTFRYLDISSVGRGEIVEEPKTLRFENAPSRARRIVRMGDTIVSTVRTYLRAVLPIRDDADDLIASTGFAVLSPGSGIDSRFLSWYAQSDPFIEEVVARSVGVSYPAIAPTELARFPVPNPALPEQRAIADFLDAETARIDALIEKKQDLWHRLTERRDSATESTILGADGPQRPVAALAEYINGWPFKPGDFEPEGLPVIRIQQLVDAEAEPDRFQGRLPDQVRLRNGDLVFSWSGSLQVRRWQRGPAWLNQHLFRVLPRKGIDKAWLFYALTTSKRLFEPYMHGSAMTHITKPMMKAVRIPLPTSHAQQEITEELDKLWIETDELVRRLVRQIKLLTEHRQALITAAVTGQVEVSMGTTTS